MFMFLVLVLMLMSMFLILDFSFVMVGGDGLIKGFLGLLVGKGSYDSCNVKSLLYIIVVVLVYSFYHFIGFTEEVWCNIVFSGSLVGVILVSIMVMWMMHLRGYWGLKMTYNLKYQESMSWWLMLSKFYHHISTPLVMLLRVFMNFLIGQGGKWGLIIASLSMSLGSLYMISSLFFLYELMVVVLQSFIFCILSYEILGLMYPYKMPSKKVVNSKGVGQLVGLIILILIYVLSGG